MFSLSCHGLDKKICICMSICVWVDACQCRCLQREARSTNLLELEQQVVSCELPDVGIENLTHVLCESGMQS